MLVFVVIVGAFGFIASIGFPDLDISLLGIGLHRFFLFHSAIIPLFVYLLLRPLTRGNPKREVLVASFCGSFFLGFGIHLFQDAFQSKAVIFPFIGSLVRKTSLDDRLWLAVNSLVSIIFVLYLLRKVFVFITSQKNEPAAISFTRKKKKRVSRIRKTDAEAAKKTSAFEIFADAQGNFRFRLNARNGEVILTGDAYKTKKECMDGILSVKKNIEDSEIEIIPTADNM